MDDKSRRRAEDQNTLLIVWLPVLFTGLLLILLYLVSRSLWQLDQPFDKTFGSGDLALLGGTLLIANTADLYTQAIRAGRSESQNLQICFCLSLVFGAIALALFFLIKANELRMSGQVTTAQSQAVIMARKEQVSASRLAAVTREYVSLNTPSDASQKNRQLKATAPEYIAADTPQQSADQRTVARRLEAEQETVERKLESAQKISDRDRDALREIVLRTSSSPQASSDYQEHWCAEASVIVGAFTILLSMYVTRRVLMAKLTPPVEARS